MDSVFDTKTDAAAMHVLESEIAMLSHMVGQFVSFFRGWPRYSFTTILCVYS